MGPQRDGHYVVTDNKECVQGLGWRCGLGGLPTLLWCWVQEGMRSILFLLPIPNFCFQLFRNGSWDFCTFWSRICPNCTCTQLFLVPYSFFIFCSWKRGVSRYKLCSIAAKDPRSQRCLSFLIMSTETDVSGLFYFFIQMRMEHTKHTILYFIFSVWQISWNSLAPLEIITGYYS